ncbi:MAG: hypothetical protein LH467_12105 [Gemmatimonadaceae bacterium]|nr:hypothetical protein [Gemmatimonadaceae bacterium]
MDPRSAAHVLTQIAAHLELRGESGFKIRAYEQAARALTALGAVDLAALDIAGSLASTRGLGPATLSVVRDLITTGESRYLEQLRAVSAPGLLALLRIPGLAAAKIHRLRAELGVESVDDLGHPTGRLLLSRDAYAIDMDAVLEKAGGNGVAMEINADPRRLDLDWRLIPTARAHGITFEIGPDAHSTQGLDNMPIGVGIARKGGLGCDEVLNARSADDVLAFARARHTDRRR